MRVKSIGLLAVACLALLSSAPRARGGELPANTWTKLSEHPTKLGYLAPMVWLPEQKRGLVWSALYCSSGRPTKEYLQVNLFDPRTGKWETRPSTFPAKSSVAVNKAGWPCVYLPSLKRVLLLGEGRTRRRKLITGSWLLDPARAAWEPVPGMTRMRDNSTDFNPDRTGKGKFKVITRREGWAVPMMGTLCYDAHNMEAVSIGGGEVWGRVEKVKEKVKPGDWIYDETADPPRTRRLVAADAGKNTEARRWHPGNVGTWTFSEATKKWAPLDQLISEQPPGRIWPSAAYDAAERKIVLFGGDDMTGCLNDTWIYDCRTKKWSQAKPKGAPPARACAGMVYVPDQKVILMAGGYGTGWKTRTDVWAFETAKNKWTRLGLDLPVQVGYCWASYLPEKKTVLLRALVKTTYRPPTSHIYGLRLDFAGAPKPAAKLDAGLKYHCQYKDKRVVSKQPTPEEFASPANKASDPAAVKKQLAALPANTWKQLQPPLKVAVRIWGTCLYNPRTHKLYTYGGAHEGYQGGDMSEYNLLTNRWDGMVDPPDMKPRHHAKMSGDNIQGVPFRGGPWTSHAHRSYGIDPFSKNIVTLHGSLYSIEERRYVGNLGKCPGKWSQGNAVDCVSTPHGLYGYVYSGLFRANVAGGKWDPVAIGKDGPYHRDQDSMCYDSKRDVIWHFGRRDMKVWSFDFKTRKWAQQKAEGKIPSKLGGWPAYIPKMDGALFTYSAHRKARPQLYFYNVAEKKWYVAPYKGEKFGAYGGLNNDVFWDPELGVALRATFVYRSGTEVGAMRLVPEQLGLKPLGD